MRLLKALDTRRLRVQAPLSNDLRGSGDKIITLNLITRSITL